MSDNTTRHLWTTFSDDQIDLNYRSPEVLLAMVDVLLCYLEKGAEYVRLDAVGFIWKEPGTSCIHHYLERGFNMDDSRNNGEFSTQEIRAYLPLTLGNHSVTPYTRIGLDRWSNWDWQDDIEREGHDFNRVGLFYGYDFQNGLSVSLEYAFEWQDHDEGDSDKFHYAGVGVNYSF